MFYFNACIKSYTGEQRRIQEVLYVSETYEADPKVLIAAHLVLYSNLRLVHKEKQLYKSNTACLSGYNYFAKAINCLNKVFESSASTFAINDQLEGLK